MSGDAPTSDDDLGRYLWLWPVVLFFGALLFTAFVEPNALRAMLAKDRDGGVVEHLTVITLLPGIAAGALTVLRHRAAFPAPWIGAWVGLWTLACVYFAGEEMSWGQHLFGWETPAAVEALNDQGETNLHNMSSWLDQKPRALVEAWIVIGGLLLPLWRSAKGRSLDPLTPPFWVLPAFSAVAASAAMILTRVPEPLGEALGLPRLVPLSSSELRELFVAAFLSLYLLSIHKRASARGGG